jgi:hypothetical protein
VNARLVVVGLAVLGALASTGAAAPADEVTLKMERFLEPGTNFMRVRFSGAVSNRSPGEYVTVMEQRCGARFSTAMAAATTGPGGIWEATPSTYYQHAPLLPGTFRARWNGQLSELVSFRPPLQMFVRRKGGGRRFDVFVQAHATLRGEFLELQRLIGGQWKRVKYLRLGTVYRVSFAVRRGWTMRVFAPPETAAPCYTAGATQTFRS